MVISFRRHFDHLLRSWHPFLAREFRSYITEVARNGGSKRFSRQREKRLPYWLLFPKWLAGQYGDRKRSSVVPRTFLKDILWGQYCLFLFVKLHDDVFDSHTNRLLLIFAGDRVLLEAHRVFARHFERRSQFWSFYYSCVNDTLNAIASVDASQLGGRVSRPMIARLYARGYAVCKVGFYAVSLKSKRMNTFAKLSRCADGLAVAGQLLDDFEDMEKDLQRGRLNYAAAFVSGARHNGSVAASRTLQRIARNILFHGAADDFFAFVRTHVRRAAGISSQMRMRKLTDYIQSVQDSVEAMQLQLHRKRVKLILR